jgi:membrane-associated protease RseP (regulator of RpoE activity)
MGFFRPRDRPLLNLGLLILTACSTVAVYYAVYSSRQTRWPQIDPAALLESAQFAAALLLILGSHEMGHYVLARIHGVDTSLPYFIPAPLGVGTFGAVIRIRGEIPHRNALVDIGAAGPLAGLAVAIPIVIWGLHHSAVGEAPAGEIHLFPGSASLWGLVGRFKELAGSGAPANAPVRFGDNLLLLFLQWLVLGPLPEGKEVYFHPTVLAAWFGMLVTTLNLVPLGQLDGGHLSYALFGERARGVGKAVALLMVAMCLFFSIGWGMWLLVSVAMTGFRHPPVKAPEDPLTAGRRFTCALCALALLVCVMPTPISQVVLR